MHVGVHQARQNEFAAGRKHFPGPVRIDFIIYPDHLAAGQRQVEPPLAILRRIHQITIFDQQIIFFHDKCLFMLDLSPALRKKNPDSFYRSLVSVIEILAI